MKDLFVKALANMERRHARYDTRTIAKAWVEIGKNNPVERVTTPKGLVIDVRRKVDFSKVTYEAFAPGIKSRVAWMHTGVPMGGRVQVTNANVYEVGNVDYRRQGIATAIYDLIERDVQAAGGEGLEPHWGSMNDEAIAFWKKRRPDHATDIAKLNNLGTMASGLFD